MACFLIPAAEAVITTVATKVIKSKEKEETMKVSFSDGTIADATKTRLVEQVTVGRLCTTCF